ncbi:3-ketoacyl-CoA synthase 19-like [Cucurbita pepo subsp. pepo]|uniref:3-ketoacyl-CoA synthase 19-like n=1 Tax=Cucurbita pepo subsp. pepo TaxID=3664 RepID=UPI000C9D5263|nr:3-ketoacyl-CoA synthase 19-like [Cucurbita pepo subsp. pepo]
MGIFMVVCLLSLFYSFFCIWKLILQRRDQCCYLLGYECYKATEDRKLGVEACVNIILRNRNLGLEEYRYLLKSMVNSGLGGETYGPKNIIAAREESPSLSDAISEMDDVFSSALDKLFAKTGVSPSDIDILVVNVSLFSPAPSLTARIINRYKMREDVKAFNLSGMGCSASIVAIDLVKHLFKTNKNAYAVVVSTESIGPNWYSGKEQPMMLTNCLYRSGGCSMLFTNKAALKDSALLKLKCILRTHLGSSNEAYGCSIQVEDDHGHRGFRLTKHIKAVATQALTINLQTLLPRILPLRELLRYAILTHPFYKTINGNIEAKKVRLNLKTGVDHFGIPPTERAVIDGIGKSLGLSDYDLEPARMALHRFGNTSTGGLWYVLGYMEAKKRLKEGDKILMISFGAGYECNSCVWEVMSNLEDENVWKDCIHSYPAKFTVNPLKEKCSWLNDERLSFVKFDDVKHNLQRQIL